MQNLLFRKVSLSTKDFEVVSPAPVFTIVRLTSNKAVRISFDANLQGPANCADIFDDQTLALIEGTNIGFIC